MEDLMVVEHELSYPPDEIPTSAVCFHAQQCVEKLLKAFLIESKQEFGKTHNLEHLIELCGSIDKDFLQLDVGNLSFYAVEVRYPDEFFIPSVEEAKKCLQIAYHVKSFVFKKLTIDDKELYLE